MFDPFDAFDPIDAVPASEPLPDVEGVDRHQGEPDTDPAGIGPETEPSDSRAPDSHPDSHPGAPLESEPRADEASELLRDPRRWVAAARRPLQPGDASLLSGREGRRRSEAITNASPPAEDASDEVPGSLRNGKPASLLDVAALRAMALPELRAAAERLRAHGHYAILVDELSTDEPAIAVLFRPDPGPLAQSTGASRDPARFVLRLEPGSAASQVLAGFSGPLTHDSFTPLEREAVDRVSPAWVSQRFLEFVQRSLAAE